MLRTPKGGTTEDIAWTVRVRPNDELMTMLYHEIVIHQGTEAEQGLHLDSLEDMMT